MFQDMIFSSFAAYKPYLNPKIQNEGSKLEDSLVTPVLKKKRTNNYLLGQVSMHNRICCLNRIIHHPEEGFNHLENSEVMCRRKGSIRTNTVTLALLSLSYNTYDYWSSY